MVDIDDMKLHEVIWIVKPEIDQSSTVQVMKVPGGWNYLYQDIDIQNVQFVPCHNPNKEIANSGNYSELEAKLKKAEDALKEIEYELTDDEITPHEALIMLTNIALITDKYNG